MPENIISLPIIGREATVRAESIDREANEIEVIWTTGAVVQRHRWEGWDDLVEYDEELIVGDGAIRLERLNGGAPFLNSHRAWRLDDVLGTVVPGSVRIEAGRGYATIRLTSAPDAESVVHRILEGTVNRVSVGYRVHEYKITKRDGSRELWQAVDWEPFEISAVAMPADPGAEIRSEGPEPSKHPCVITREDAPAASAAHQWKGQNMPNDDPMPGGAEQTRNQPVPTQPAPQSEAPPTAEQIRAEERARTAEITMLCQRHGMGAEFMAQQISGGASIDAVRGAILDHLAAGDATAARGAEPTPAQAQRDTGAAYRAAIENALIHRHDPSRELTAAGRDFRALTLMELARQALERSGVNTRGMSKMDLASAALGQRAATGYHATGDFPAILANVGNITLRAAYDAVPRTFTSWARRATLSDFRPTTRVQVSNAPQLEKVPEGAEFKYGSFGEAKAQYTLATYGKIVAFTRQMLINDDLGAFTRVAQSFGARAAELEGDLVYAILLTNPVMGDGKALFHADHGNLGTAAVINETSMTAAMEAYAKQTDIDGTRITVSPQYIIVPPGQRELEAAKLLTAVTPGKTADVNSYANKLQIVSERRLLPTAGQAPWFLASSAMMIDTVEYAYLDGQDGLFTETRNGFEVDGVEVKARLDFAASAIDHRGLFKNPGAAAG